MSSFSNSILELLLSWVRGIFNDVWSIFSGDNGSFFAWLGRHWLPLICVLLIGGVTLDLIIYILRWQPQRVWASKLNRIFHKNTQEDIVFNDGYEMGIESFELDSDPLISEYINDQSAPSLEQFDAGIHAAAQPLQPDALQPETQTPVRRRRSDRHVRRGARKRFISIKLPSLEENESAYSAYPAPPVHVREAFYDAVYPSDTQPQWQQSTDNHANS